MNGGRDDDTVTLEPAADERSFVVEGACGRPVHGATLMTRGAAAAPRAASLTVHGWTGHKDRNIVPLAAELLRAFGCVSHRITLGHAGVREGEDEITDAEAFSGDRLDNATADVRATLGLMERGEIIGRALPFVLVAHSRGGAQAIRIAATSARERWPIRPAGVIALAPVSRHGYLAEAERTRLVRDGFVERPCARAPGGRVRMNRSWFEHWMDEPERDHFAEDVRDVACPMLVVHGEADASVGLEHAERIERLAAEHGKADWSFARIQRGDHNFSAKGFLRSGVTYQRSVAHPLAEAMRAFVDAVV